MTLKLNGSSSGSVSIDAPAATTGGADVTFKLPVADGTNGQALTTNASGQLGFSNLPAAYSGEATLKAWAAFDGDGDINATLTGGNIASLTDNASGRYIVTFDTDFADDNYMMAGCTGQSNMVGFHSEATLAADACTIGVLDDDGGYQDIFRVSVGFWR